MSFAISKDPYQQNGTLGILAGCRNTAGNSLSTVQSFEDFGWEIYLILIDSTTSNNKTRPFRNKKAIRERKVIHRQSSSRDWEEKEDLSNLDRHPSCYNFLTEARAVETMRLFHEAIKFSHLLHRYLGPPLCFYDHRNLLSQRLDIRGVCRQIIKYVRQDLGE